MQIVDKQHFTECNHLNRYGSPDQFVPILRDFSLSHLSKDKLNIVIDWYQWLHKQIQNQLQNDVWTIQNIKSIQSKKESPPIRRMSLSPISAPSPSVFADLNAPVANQILS
jgi:hypothetical protein